MASAEIHVELVYCPGPGAVDSMALTLPAGSTVADAVHTSGVLARHGLVLDTLSAGVWSKLRAWDSPLRERDRVELYRPLLVDPKEARRLRYKRHKKAAAQIV
jgi:uncharacterized protein